MYRDTGEPGRELRAPCELTEVLERPYISVLHHILGLAVILQYRACYAVQASVVAPHHHFIQRRVSRQNPLNNFFIRQS